MIATAVARPEAALRRLAAQYGVQTSFYDVDRRRRRPTPAALLGVLRALGAPVERIEDAPAAARERRESERSRMLEPVAVAWEGIAPPLEVRLPARGAASPIAWRLELEDGDARSAHAGRDELPPAVSPGKGAALEVRRLSLPAPLPFGYHRLRVEAGGRSAECLVVSAPRSAYVPAAGAPQWGVFIPLYALRSRRSWGSGDFADLEQLAHWAAKAGSAVVGTLPLFASFMGHGREPFAPSPYTPATRLFWSEFFIDVSRVPELERCPAARELIASPGFQHEIEALRSQGLVDYRRGMALKRRALSELARTLFADAPPRLAALRRFEREHPEVVDYARFRALTERLGPWRGWPEPLRSGAAAGGDAGEEARYHLYAQWIAGEQLEAVARGTRRRGAGLYFDLPLGVHPDGYDAWRERLWFAEGATTGAPPDTFFRGGQDWGFAPPHPQRMREQGYACLRAVLRGLLSHASVLRIDHVMGLSRLYWIPEGMSAEDGVYVRYREDELYAIVCLESQRRRALIVGEDLGTVPRYVEAALARRRIQRMYVLQFQASPDGIRRPARDTLASLNTHDMPPFAAWWQRLGAGERAALLAALRRAGLLEEGTADAGHVLRACLRFLAGSRSRLVLVNLEDLWGETRPQNAPGTAGAENWRRIAGYPLEEMRRAPEVAEVLRAVRLGRQKARDRKGGAA